VDTWSAGPESSRDRRLGGSFCIAIGRGSEGGGREGEEVEGEDRRRRRRRRRRLEEKKRKKRSYLDLDVRLM